MSSAYVTIRDDSGIRSLSTNEQDFLRSCALKSADNEEEETSNSNKILRSDGRRGNDVRKVRLQLGRWDNGAECTVQWGVGTRVTSLCSAELVPPSPDRPNEGMVNFTVDLSPMAASSFKLATAVSTGPASNLSSTRGSNHSDQYQRLLSNRILRCIERIILIGGALDTEALVLEGGKWVWRFTVALTVLDAGGNILDACVLAAMAALRHYRKPQVDLSSGETSSEDFDPNAASLPSMIPSTVKEATPLPLHHTPLSISFGLIPADDAVNSASSTSIVAALIDPTDREELVQSGSLTIAMNVHSEVCLLDYGGGCELTPDKLRECWRVAEIAIKDLCQLLESTLTKADDQAQKERLRLLQLQRLASNHAFGASDLPPLPPTGSSSKNIPYFQQIEDMDVDSNVDEDQVQKVQTEAEEAYRKQALDFSSGHIATAVRENDDRDGNSAGSRYGKQAGSLLAAMLKSVGQSGSGSDTAGSLAPASALPKMSTNDAMAETKTMNSKTDSRVGQAGTGKENGDVPAARSSTSNSVPMDLDDEDEEENPTVLHSEFESIENKTSLQSNTNNPEETEPDIEDLSMAIKSKKSKKKKSKGK